MAHCHSVIEASFDYTIQKIIFSIFDAVGLASCNVLGNLSQGGYLPHLLRWRGSTTDFLKFVKNETYGTNDRDDIYDSLTTDVWTLLEGENTM